LFEATDVILEPGVYRAKLKTILETTRQNFDDPTIEEPCYDWTFTVVEEGFEGTELRGRTSDSFGPRSKAREWVTGLVGRKIEAGDKFELDDLVGKECDLSIVHKETERGTFANIQSVNPVRKNRAQDKEEAQKARDALQGKGNPKDAELPEEPGDEVADEVPF
jgi:hypothetical protein